MSGQIVAATIVAAPKQRKARVDDRRVIRGFVHVLKSSGCWVDAPPEYGPKETLYNAMCAEPNRASGQRSLKRSRWRRPSDAGPHRLFRRQNSPLGGGRKREETNHAIGRSRSGRTTKIHALTDDQCRPLAFTLTGGNIADCTAGAALLEQLPDCEILHGDKGYDANALRRQVEERGAMPKIPPKRNRKWKNCFSPFLYRDRNAVERMFCRLKDLRSAATRYDRNAVNFLAAVCIAATISYWL